MVKVRIFFFLPSRVFQVYDCYFTNVLTQRFCFEVLLTADSQCFTRDNARIFVPTIPRRRQAFTVSWNTEVFVHCEQCGQFFLTRRPRHQFPLPADLHGHSRRPRFQQDETSSLLDHRRLESIQTYSAYQLVSHLGTSMIHNAVSRHLDKNRAKHRRTVFSMYKAQESKQRSTNWRRRHLGNMQQQPRRWPGFDKCVKTKLRLDAYIRPWPPGWSFLRRIYTSRGSERVNVENPVFANGKASTMWGKDHCPWKECSIGSQSYRANVQKAKQTPRLSNFCYHWFRGLMPIFRQLWIGQTWPAISDIWLGVRTVPVLSVAKEVAAPARSPTGRGAPGHRQVDADWLIDDRVSRNFWVLSVCWCFLLF